MNYAREKYPNLGHNELVGKSAELFRNATRAFMKKTLELGKRLRPKAKWGYYGYPYCYRHDMSNTDCSFNQKKMNDENMWLYKASTALYPSVYLYKGPLPKVLDTGIWIHKVIGETRRIQIKMRKRFDVPAFIYMRFEYPSEGGDTSIRFLTKADTVFSYRLALDLGMSGIIFWGSSNQIKERCQGLETYLNDIVKPIAKESNKYCNKCERILCSPYSTATSREKCVRKYKRSLKYVESIYNSSYDLNIYPKTKQETTSHYFCQSWPKL